MTENKNRTIFLVDKVKLAHLAKTGEILKDDDKTSKKTAQDKVYVSIKKQSAEEKATSPSENMSVLLVRNEISKEERYNPAIVKKYMEMKQNGTIPKNVRVTQEPIEEYLEKQFNKYSVDFEKAIQSRDNTNVALVARYINDAVENNNQVALGMMKELIKKDPNFAILFEGGELDFEKIRDIADMEDHKATVGLDELERKDDETAGKFDSTKATAREIDKAAENEFEQNIENEAQEAEISSDSEMENSSNEKEVQEVSDKAERTFARRIATLVAGLSLIRNPLARQRAEDKKQDVQNRSKESIFNKARRNLSRIGALRSKAEDNKDNNSLNNLLKRSSLLKENAPDDEMQLEDRTRESIEKTEKDKTLRERIAERARNAREQAKENDKERELEEARRRERAGKKLSSRQQEIIKEDNDKKIELADQKMKANRTFDDLVLDKEIVQKTVSAGKEFANRSENTKDSNARGKENQEPDQEK